MKRLTRFQYVTFFLGILFLIATIYYTFIYFTTKDDSLGSQTNISVNIVDKDEISVEYLPYVEKNIYYFNLDSNNKFNPKKELLKIDSIRIIESLASKYYDYSNISIKMPYFKNFNSNDYDADTIARVTSLLDHKENYLKHYEILGYDFNKSEGVTKKEFLLMIGSMIDEIQKNDSDEIINEMMNYGFNVSNISSTLTREETAAIIETFANLRSNMR